MIFFKTSLIGLLLLSLISFSSLLTAQTFDSDSNMSAIALRQLQSRSFNTNDVDKLRNVLEEVMADLGYQKSSQVQGRYGKMLKCKMPSKSAFVPDIDLPCPLIIDPIFRKGENSTIIRFTISHNSNNVTDRRLFSELFEGMSKGLFLEANPIPSEKIN